MRTEKNPPKDLREMLNQQGLKPSENTRTINVSAK